MKYICKSNAYATDLYEEEWIIYKKSIYLSSFLTKITMKRVQIVAF